MMRRLSFRLSCAAVLLAGLLWVWPTLYRPLPLTPDERALGALELRVHRWSGRVEVLTPTRGWRRLATPFERARAHVLAEQLATDSARR